MSKTISFSLSSSSIQAAINEMNAYISGLKSKTKRLQEMITESIRWNAQEGFSSAIADDIYRGGTPPAPDVTVTVEDDGDVTVIIASGKDAVFIEFGAGVYHNGAAGSSPHPKGAENGYLIGEYGKGLGKRNTWALPGSTKDNPILTHGTPAAMPMYRGLQTTLDAIAEMAQEVFG